MRLRGVTLVGVQVRAFFTPTSTTTVCLLVSRLMMLTGLAEHFISHARISEITNACINQRHENKTTMT